MASLDQIPEVERLSRDELVEEQHRSLQVQLANLRERSPFYRQLFEAVFHPSADGMKPARGQPITTRMDLVSAQHDIPPWGGLLAVPTDECSILGFTNAIASGMDGYPELLLAATAEDMRMRVALAARAFAMGGATASDRTAIIGEVARSILHHVILGGLVEVGSTPFQIGRGLTLRHVRHTLPILAPTQIVTHPTYALHLASLLEDEGTELPVERLFLWGEVGPSVPSIRKTLEEAWGHASIRDVYALEELGIIAAECGEGDGLHGFEDAFIYEIVDPNSDEVLGDGERGELVLTPLFAHAMPLLRYRTGDLVSADHDECACGRTHLRLHVLGKVVPGPGGPTSIDLAAIEQALGDFSGSTGRYRVVIEPSGPVLEVAAPEGAGTDKDPSQNLATSAARRCDIKLRTVDALPDFFHRSTRVVHSKDIGLWAAQAEEQRRLEQ
jgi:phenylacetate-CoA ligase